MTLELALTLGALALVDSLSIGTLLIPLFLLIAPGRVRVGRMLLYLGTIAGFYFVLGIAVTAGAGAVVEGAAAVLDTPAARWAQLLIGAGLIVWSFFIGKDRPGRTESPRRGRLGRWRDRLLGEGPASTVVVVALGAGLIEAATMLPYLGAVGLITNAGLDPSTWIPVLAAYCLVMIAPALVLLALRVAARPVVEPALARFAAWLQRSSGETTAWVVGIVGFLLARDALATLGVLEQLDGFGVRVS